MAGKPFQHSLSLQGRPPWTRPLTAAPFPCTGCPCCPQDGESLDLPVSHFSVKGYRFRNIPAYLHHHAAKALKQGLELQHLHYLPGTPPAAVFWTDIDPIQFRCALLHRPEGAAGHHLPVPQEQAGLPDVIQAVAAPALQGRCPKPLPILPVHRPDQLPEARVPAVGQPGL